jgi:rubrerythrin
MKAAEQKILKQRIAKALTSKTSSVKEHVELLNHEYLSGQSHESRLALLKKTLQQAVELEFGTIPIYLCALWSIKDNLHPVAKSIRNVVQEEMLHLALACNMLASIGGRPKLYDTTNKGLRYPTHLPGGVHPELVLKLSGLTDDQLDDFLEIELPHEKITLAPFKSKYADAHDGTHSSTIGELYDAINHEFNSLRPKLTADCQVSGPLSWFVVDTFEKIDDAIAWIKEQGEGAAGNSPKLQKLGELSHFYRFWEVRKRQKIELNPETNQLGFGSPLEFPEVWPMAVVPEGGYHKKDVSPQVWNLVSGFNKTYSDAICTLEKAWGPAGQAAMWQAIEKMFDLEKTAIPLMQIPRPDGKGNYGPDFKMIKL